MLSPIIKQQQEDPLLTPKQVAEAMHVDRKTVVRWISLGLLHGVRTPGGHWRIRRSVAERAIQEASYRGRANP